MGILLQKKKNPTLGGQQRNRVQRGGFVIYNRIGKRKIEIKEKKGTMRRKNIKSASLVVIGLEHIRRKVSRTILTPNLNRDSTINSIYRKRYT